MRCKLTTGVLRGVFVFLRKIGIRSIKTVIPTIIPTKIINKMLMMVIIFKENRFFLTDKIIYIIYINKLYNFPKQISIDKY